VLVALGEIAERLTPEAVPSPEGKATIDGLPRKLEYESPIVEGTIQDDLSDPKGDMVEDTSRTTQEETTTPSISDELQRSIRIPGQVQTL
jgi:hypothetical protein